MKLLFFSGQDLILILVLLLLPIGFFLLLRALVLWYWKVDIVVDNQDKQCKLLERQIALLEKQNELLNEIRIHGNNQSYQPKKIIG